MVTDLPEAQLASLGPQLKAHRIDRHWTLDDLARHSGLSKSYLSRLESGERRASIAAILTLSRLFGVSLATLFQERVEEPIVIVRAGRTASYLADGLTCWPLSVRTAPLQLQPLRVLVAPDRETEEYRRHDGEEWVYVLAGELTLLVGAQAHDLDAGDAAHFDARLPHRLIARSGREAEVLLVAAPGQSRAGPLPWSQPLLSAKTPSSAHCAQARLEQPNQNHEPGIKHSIGVSGPPA